MSLRSSFAFWKLLSHDDVLRFKVKKPFYLVSFFLLWFFLSFFPRWRLGALRYRFKFDHASTYLIGYVSPIENLRLKYQESSRFVIDVRFLISPREIEFYNIYSFISLTGLKEKSFIVNCIVWIVKEKETNEKKFDNF